MQITHKIHALRHPFSIPVAPGITFDRFVYSYILAGETIALIDTGVAGCERRIFEYLRSIGRDPCEISLIILTHSHPDHIGGAKAIREKTGCTIIAHKGERCWIEDVNRQSRDRPVPGFSSLVGGSVLIDHEVEGGDLIDPDGTATCELQVFHTPGHSAGSISLFCAAEGALFTGDAVPVEGDLPVYDDALASVHSVQTLRSIRDFHHLLSSWDIPRRGERAYFQMERALAYLQKIHEVILHISSEGKTDSMDVANEAAAALGLPPQAVSPLLARTLEANLCVRNTRNLIR